MTDWQVCLATCDGRRLANSHDLHVRQLLPATTAAAAATNREHIELSLTRQQVEPQTTKKNKTKRERETPVTGVERQKANDECLGGAAAAATAAPATVADGCGGSTTATASSKCNCNRQSSVLLPANYSKQIRMRMRIENCGKVGNLRLTPCLAWSKRKNLTKNQREKREPLHLSPIVVVAGVIELLI